MDNPGQLQRRDGQWLGQLSLGHRWLTNTHGRGRACLDLAEQLILVTVAKETAAHEAQAGLWLAAQINGNAPVTSWGQQIKIASEHSALRAWSSSRPFPHQTLSWLWSRGHHTAHHRCFLTSSLHSIPVCNSRR